MVFINYGWYAQEGKEKEELWIQLYPCIAPVQGKRDVCVRDIFFFFILFAGTRRDKARTEGYLLPKKFLWPFITCVSARESQPFEQNVAQTIQLLLLTYTL